MTLYRLVKKNGEAILTTNSVSQMVMEILSRKDGHCVEIVKPDGTETESIKEFLKRFRA